MPFPKTERVIYKKNPLKQVICQLRYPTILRIDKDAPADFQEIVRHKFPIFQEDNETANLQLPENIAHMIPSEIFDLVGSRNNRRFQFLTKDRVWNITLTRDFVALETSKYTRWEEYSTYLELVLNALVDVYAPSFLTRIGLRYRNVIDREELGLADKPWHDLFVNFILGELAVPEIHNLILEQKGSAIVQLDNDEDLVRIQHGLVQDNSKNPSNTMYLLDSDFYTKKDTETEIDNVITKLKEYNSLNRRLFRWCIKDQLHDSMEPESI